MTAEAVSEIKKSPILAPTLKSAISFKIGEPDFDTPPHIVMAGFQALIDGKTHYAPPEGIPQLREAIAKKSIEENKIECTKENVMVSAAKHAIFCGILSTIDKGEEVILPEPSWVSYVPCIKIAGGREKYVKVRGKEFVFSAEDIAEAITSKTRMIIINTPSNPTGAVLEKHELKGIADLAMDHDLIVLSDEIYEKVIYEGKHISIGSFDDMIERTIIINGFSKSYAMTGWRIGYAIAPKNILENMIKVQQHSITCVAPFVQYAALAALEQKEKSEKSIKEMVEEFRKRRDFLVKELNEIDGLHSLKPKGAFYVFPSFDYNFTSTELSKFLLKLANIEVTPGIAFGPNCDNYIRFSYATSGDNIKIGIRRIKKIVPKLLNH